MLDQQLFDAPEAVRYGTQHKTYNKTSNDLTKFNLQMNMHKQNVHHFQD